MLKNAASFRDPSGYVLEGENCVYRIISSAYENDWRLLKESDFLAKMLEYGLIPFKELDPKNCPFDTGNAIAVLESPKLPFISYPYEWCFSQLKDAALLTLTLQKLALEYAFTLKDATAFNVQFWNGKPVFIDLLSFEKLREGRPWDAYGQFCQHFLAPLALMSYNNERLGLLTKNWIDGIPIEIAAQLLPFKTKLSLGLGMHIHMHSLMRTGNAETGRRAKSVVKEVKVPRQRLIDIADSLASVINSLPLPRGKTEWGDYYTDTNYLDISQKAKASSVERIASLSKGKIALDLGANNGFYSALLTPYFEEVLSTDIDHAAVNHNWINLANPKILPLILDLANPSPAIGWNNTERLSFRDRCQADFISSLALVHHLRITAGIPAFEIMQCFTALLKPGGTLLLEFVPKEDSQVKRLLSRREDVFYDYDEESFIKAAREQGLSLAETISLPESLRKLLVFKKV